MATQAQIKKLVRAARRTERLKTATNLRGALASLCRWSPDARRDAEHSFRRWKRADLLLQARMRQTAQPEP